MPIRMRAKDLEALLATPAGKASGLRALEPDPKTNKYHAQPTEYRGDRYDSRDEARHAANLDLLLAAGEITEWQRQFPIRLEVNGKLICTYRADFYVLFPDGHYELQEVKGVLTPEFKLKRKLLAALRPDLPLILYRKGQRL